MSDPIKQSLATFVIMLASLVSPFNEVGAQDDRLTTVQKYLLMIAELEKSTPADQGVSQKEYDASLADLYFEVAFSYYENYGLKEAMDYFATSLSYYEKAGDKDMQIFVSRPLGTIAKYLGKYDMAAEYWRSALRVAEEVNDRESIVKLLLSCYDLALLTNDSDDLSRILARIKSYDGDLMDQNTRINLIQTSFNYALRIGDVDLACLYLEEYKALVDKASEDTRADVMKIYQIYEVQYYDRAGRYRDAAESMEKTLGEEQTQVEFLVSCARILYYYAFDGDREKVESYRQRISGFENTEGITPETWAMIRSYMRMAFSELGMYEDALEQMDEIEKSGVKDEWFNLYKGSLLHKLGRNEEALEYFVLQLQVSGEKYGKDSRRYADALRNLANMEGFCGMLESGSQHYIESVNLLRTVISKELPFVSFDRLEGYWKDVSDGIVEMTAYAIEAGILQSEFTVSAYEALAMFKGFLFSSEKVFSEYVQESDDKGLHNLYEKILGMREQMEDLRKDYSGNQSEIIALQSALSLAESELIQYFNDFPEYEQYIDISYSALSHILKDNEVVVDFVDYRSEKFGRKYAAFVYRRGWDAPVIVPVCTQADLDSYESFRTRPDAIYGRKASTFFLDLLWQPLESYVRDGDVVYMIPSGDFHLISFDSFQQRDRKLLGSRYDFVRLSSARELLSGVSSSVAASDAVLYGGLHYDMTASDRVTEAGKHEVRRSRPSSRGFRGSGVRFSDLPMSGEEVASVSSLLNDRGVSARCYIGKEGTEESFLSLSSSSPDILHFATHGFYYTPEEATSVSGLSGYKSAMRLSGLVLSGGNAEWMGEDIPEETMGGLLTADDIAQCDLSGTDLVVLTACDTGRGKVTSEGVYGLQRAFKKAGAGTVLMSLWQADDKASAEFIGYFYDFLTSNGWDKHSALKSAKEQMRKKYPSPYYWAGFVMLD